MDANRQPPETGTVAGGDWGFRGLLVALCLGLYLAGASHTSVFDRDEARFALAVKEMGERGDWLLPSNFGAPRYNKPILCYWLALASTRAFGMNEAALRLPSALCSIVTVLATMAIAQRWRGRRIARISGVVIATALYVVIEARSLTADASLLAATTLSFWSWLELRRRPVQPLRWQLLFWIGVGLGLLAKVVNVAFLGAAACALAVLQGSFGARGARGTRWLLGAVLIGAVATAIPGAGFVGPATAATIGFAFAVRSLRSAEGRSGWLALGAPWGLPLALLMFLAWGIPATLATDGGFIAQGLGHHLLGRTAAPYEGHSGWPGYYLVATLVAFFPWGSLLPAALAAAWHDRQDDGHAFLLAWVLGPLVLVELAVSKLPHYMLITFPALAILVATLIDARIRGDRGWSMRERLFEIAVFVVVCLGVAAVVVHVRAQFGATAVGFAAGVLLGVSLAVAAVVVIGGIKSSPDRIVPGLAASAVILYATAFIFFLPALEPERLSPRLGLAVAQHLRNDERLALCKIGEASVGFYLPRTPDVMGDADSVARALQHARGDTLLLVPDDQRNLLARLQAGDNSRWELVETVDGVILPSLATRRVKVVRRHGTTGAAGD